jgi:hypothetical protein
MWWIQVGNDWVNLEHAVSIVPDKDEHGEPMGLRIDFLKHTHSSAAFVSLDCVEEFLEAFTDMRKRAKAIPKP